MNVPITAEPGQWRGHEDHRPESRRACDITGCVTRPALGPVSSPDPSPPEREEKNKLERRGRGGLTQVWLESDHPTKRKPGKKGVVTASSPNLPAANLFTGKILLPAPLLISGCTGNPTPSSARGRASTGVKSECGYFKNKQWLSSLDASSDKPHATTVTPFTAPDGPPHTSTSPLQNGRHRQRHQRLFNKHLLTSSSANTI